MTDWVTFRFAFSGGVNQNRDTGMAEGVEKLRPCFSESSGIIAQDATIALKTMVRVREITVIEIFHVLT